MSKTSPAPDLRRPLSPAVLYLLLALSDGPRHGYAIKQEAEARSDGRVPARAGHALRRHPTSPRCRAGPRDRRASAPANGQEAQRRYYELTERGRNAAARRGARPRPPGRVHPHQAQARVMRLYRLLLRRLSRPGSAPASKPRFSTPSPPSADSRATADAAPCGSRSTPSTDLLVSARAVRREPASNTLPIPQRHLMEALRLDLRTPSSSSFAVRGSRSPRCCRWPSASAATRRSLRSPTASSSTRLPTPSRIASSRSARPSRACLEQERFIEAISVPEFHGHPRRTHAHLARGVRPRQPQHLRWRSGGTRVHGAGLFGPVRAVRPATAARPRLFGRRAGSGRPRGRRPQPSRVAGTVRRRRVDRRAGHQGQRHRRPRSSG